jgi:hypothetical protein
MNRRDFIKAASVTVALPVIVSAEEKGCGCPAGPKGEAGEPGWRYVVYCYERDQGEWTFSKNTRGSFAHQREYMTFEEDQGWPYAGWMDGGKLHFKTLDDATDFVEMHVRAKYDINLIDSIYDVYLHEVTDGRLNEIQVAHYWFNGDTGRQIHWVDKKDVHTNWGLVEFS